MSFKIKKLEKIAIVGESGSGKTTLINLLLRFYDPDKGKIYYNNIDIKDIPLEVLRKQVAVVSQDTYLFNGTIMENLKLAKEDASMDELISACKAAKIHDFISGMEEGYLTFVGEMGLNLSGGQRQRIAIARALLKNAPLIILDEATSSVDIENEKAIQESLDILLKNKTSITIAHRLSTIKNVDRILVLKDGEIVEEGKHKELIKNKKEYYKLILAQREVM
ncbi:ABC superfamily ATP binding cassette transporter, ABC/membrane protein [Peptoniphilus indolicus ATCC 29427]|uniref:ABC superfamily ATP binding cassette transporter, ABC/membrane protein n=2 Tax=Peptoniphilus indolicus TaxID=33030 RepID=G4D3M1_9FIRM|nr:ATP-binding cassette domain-containing protein [Peptoniphilus indolicus]EGY79883.1 ABC superfamily ATP binding cassette transporter, ABC/membrane protein [Peptoniphilus indolicus ATCC 29427]